MIRRHSPFTHIVHVWCACVRLNVNTWTFSLHLHICEQDPTSNPWTHSNEFTLLKISNSIISTWANGFMVCTLRKAISCHSIYPVWNLCRTTKDGQFDRWMHILCIQQTNYSMWSHTHTHTENTMRDFYGDFTFKYTSSCTKKTLFEEKR